MDPIRTNDPLLNQVSEILEDAISPMDGVDSFHDLRSVPGPTHTNIILDLVVRQDCTMDESEIQGKLESAVRKSCPTCYLVITYENAYTTLFPKKPKRAI